MKNNFELKKIVFLGFVFFMSFSVWAEKKESVLTREVSLEDSFKETLQVNKVLRNKSAEQEKQIEQLNAKNSLYIERLKNLDSRIKDLRGRLSTAKAEALKEMARLERELQFKAATAVSLSEKIKELEVAVEDEKRENKYFNRMVTAETELNRAQNLLKDLTRKFEKSIQENGKLHYNLGNVLFEKGDYEKAAYEYEVALENLPGDLDICYNLAITYDYYLDQGEKAARYYALYLKGNPDSKESLKIKERIITNDFRGKVTKSKK